jgi:hypothetical protein
MAASVRIRIWTLAACPLVGFVTAAIAGDENGGRVAFLLIALPALLAFVSSMIARLPLPAAVALAVGAGLVGVAGFIFLLILAGLSGALA